MIIAADKAGLIQTEETVKEGGALAKLSYHLYNEDVALDALIDLCKKGDVKITDIFVSDIVEKFLAYVSELADKDYEEISSFIVLAATLIEIKTRELLPKSELLDSELPDPEALKANLFAVAEEYRLLREASDKLREFETLNCFSREPAFGEKDYKIIIKNYDMNKLIEAFSRLLERVEFEEDSTVEKTIAKERFTVAEALTDLMEKLRYYKTLSLFGLFDKGYSKLEIINTFLAVLEIVKDQMATIEEADEDFILSYSPEGDKLESGRREELFKDADSYN